MYGFVGRACREIPRSGSQRSSFLARDLPENPNRSRPSCIISCIIGGRASEDCLSRVSETSLYRGSTRSGSGRNGVRQTLAALLTRRRQVLPQWCYAELGVDRRALDLSAAHTLQSMCYAVMLTPGATLRQQQPSKRPLHLRQRCRRRIPINLPCRAIACQRSGRPVKSVQVVVRATRVCTHVRCKVPALRLSCHPAATFVVRSREVQAARETLWRTACASTGR